MSGEMILGAASLVVFKGAGFESTSSQPSARKKIYDPSTLLRASQLNRLAQKLYPDSTAVNYTYDGDGNRVKKSSGKLYWYGAGSEVLDESDASGSVTDEYVFFGGKRIAHRVISGGSIYYYAEDSIGSSRVITTSAGTVCYDADFQPFGIENVITNTCTQNVYKFEGKERDTETGNDNFGARYFSSSLGRWLSPDWSAIPAPVPYATLTNPQTLNLYQYVGNNPETFADIDGHLWLIGTQDPGIHGNSDVAENSGPPSTNPPAAQPPPQETQKPQAPVLTITYDKDAPKMTPAVENYVKDVLLASGVTSANISATTNGTHAPNSYHYDGQAVDINKVNGKPVKEASSDTKFGAQIALIQNTANNKSIGVAHENYGPAGLFKNGSQLNGKQGPNVPLQSQHDNHIHLTIPNPRRRDDD
ncbi:MAG: hypothetical protein NVS9B13_16940 [Candidatus Acidiferrum sp.]